MNAADRNEAVRPDGVPRRARQLCWCGEGETVTVGRYVLRDPLVYFSDGQPDDAEASCINRWLEVGEPVKEAAGSISDASSYAKLSPHHRANYLLWLSSGRVAPLEEIGYALLFFCGLERRYLASGATGHPS